MEATTLTLYVGLTPSDATKLFDQRLPVAPHWADRWGLKTTPKAGAVDILELLELRA